MTEYSNSAVLLADEVKSVVVTLSGFVIIDRPEAQTSTASNLETQRWTKSNKI